MEQIRAHIPSGGPATGDETTSGTVETTGGGEHLIKGMNGQLLFIALLNSGWRNGTNFCLFLLVLGPFSASWVLRSGTPALLCWLLIYDTPKAEFTVSCPRSSPFVLRGWNYQGGVGMRRAVISLIFAHPSWRECEL